VDKIHSANFQKPKASKRDPAQLKNIRQVGMPSLGYKLYIEDSVLSYLKNQMCKDDSRIIALIGTEAQTDENTYVFVEGAIRAEDIVVNGKNLSIGKKAFTSLYENMNTFFNDCTLLGWYVPMYEMIRTYGSTLGEKCKLFVLDDPTSQDEMFYIKEMNRIKKLNGYNIFYEKNDSMRNYLISCKENLEEKHRENTDIKEEKESITVEDNKTVITSKKAVAEPVRLTPFLYAASTVLAIVVLVVGITMMNNNEKIHNIQDSLETLAKQVSSSLSVELIGDAAPTEVVSQALTEAPTETAESSVVVLDKDTQVSSNNVEVVEYYVVKEGDTLAGISKKIYDSTNWVEKICQLNGIENEDSLYIGQKLYLPSE